jgi:hypothetical protein
VAIQVSNLAQRFLAHFETLIEHQIRGGVSEPMIDSKRCPHCNAIVPEIRPVPFEYCPYCEAILHSSLADQGQKARASLSRLLGSLAPDPASQNLRPAEVSARRY